MRQRARRDMANAAGINASAQALLDALGITDALSLAEANADGYYTAAQLAGMRRGISEASIVRVIRKNPTRYEFVKISGTGSSKAYRLKRK